MKKQNKILAVSILGLACAFSGVLAINQTEASANSYVKPTFYMGGASVRYSENYSGMRFSSVITESEYAKLVTLQEDYDVTFGALIAPTSELTGALTLENATDEIINVSIEEPYHTSPSASIFSRASTSSGILTVTA